MTNSFNDICEVYGNSGSEDICCKFPAIHSESRIYTDAVGAALAGWVYGGLLVILNGDLGAGKTVMARAIGRALGADNMRSPTFAIESVHRLPGRGFKLVHADLYRLGAVSAGSETALQLEEYLSGPDGALLLVEWGERWKGPRAFDRWDISITQPDSVCGGLSDYRGINLAASGMEAIERMSRAYLAILDSLSALLAASPPFPAPLADDGAAGERP